MKSLEKLLSRRLFNSLEEISIALDMARAFEAFCEQGDMVCSQWASVCLCNTVIRETQD